MSQAILSSPAPHTAAEPKASGAARERSLMIDVVKGMAILLVAFGHTAQGMMRRIPWPQGDRVENYIYSFHMPAFFFVSGVFLAASLDKRGLRRFVTNKLATIMYPFWLFALVLPWMFTVFHRLVNTPPIPLHDILLNLVTGNLSWFLPSLFVAVVAGALLRRAPLWLAFFATWGLSVWLGWHQIPVTLLERGLTLVPFLVAGMWMGRWLPLLQRIPAALSFVLAVALAYGVFVVTPIGTQPLWWGFVPVGLAGTLMLLLLAHALGSSAGARFFAWMGIASLAIFLLAPIGQVLVRAFLLAIHVRSVTAHLTLSTALAVLPPAWIYQHRERLHLGWVFVWPFGPQRR